MRARLRSVLLRVLIAAGLVGIMPTAQAQTHHHVGPTYLYPDPAVTPGVANPDSTRVNIDRTICNPSWSTLTAKHTVSRTTVIENGL